MFLRNARVDARRHGTAGALTRGFTFWFGDTFGVIHFQKEDVAPAAVREIHAHRSCLAQDWTRLDLDNADKMNRAVRELSSRMPAYITLKDVKKRWGKGQEDIFPVTQFEKLWGDMTALPDFTCRYVAAPRPRGQQLKEPA